MEENTQIQALRDAHPGCLNASERKGLRSKALVAWVQDRFGGDVAAACASPEVLGAGAAARSLASSLRTLMRMRTGAGGSAGGGDGGGGAPGE